MCRIQEVFPDSNGQVRTVKVGMRPRDSRELLLPYKSKDLWLTDVSVQRLVVVLPAAEQGVPENSSSQVNSLEVTAGSRFVWPLMFHSGEVIIYHDLYK